MNQIQDKVKDLVEVRSKQHLDDFIADLAETLAGYYFTDITADLMSKWLDRVVVMPTGSGNAYALAGYRGVGKSHFLAVFGAILSQPELRAKLKDSHVFASAERLIRRHYPVIHVRRGTKETLADELRIAVAAQFECSVAEVGKTPADIIKFASERGGAGPSVIIVDTDIEREARVSRDDGPYLSELAAAANGTNVFIAVALDDDVASADGRNSGISQSFTIDYLDHEHLYKIIDAHIFPKNNQKRSVITGIFENFRSVLPSFRWSEQRFSSVYPLHPVILEVAPFVRLFVQDFALLAFASEAGGKILGRPADSLIALDELFDQVESTLRQSSELTDAFAAYDNLNTTLISKIPVMERLRSKLVLKGLMLLSLDSEGATASDIAAAMLIFDERDPQSAISFVEDLLEKMSAASNGQVWKMERDGRAAKFGFSLSGKEHFNTALTEAVQNVPDSVVNNLLRRLMRDRFSDCEFEAHQNGQEIAQTELEWRGGVRRGRLVWNVGNHEKFAGPKPSAAGEWTIVVDFNSIDLSASDSNIVQWKPDELKPEEFDTLKRYHALMSREDLQQTFRDEFRTTIQTFTIAIEKIWERKFLQYGSLRINGKDHKFTSEAAAGHNVSEVFGRMLAPHFETMFPEHPAFAGRLEMAQVDDLAVGLFAAREGASAEVTKLAEAFAVPMGLADVNDGTIEVRPVEGLLSLYPVTIVMELLATIDGVVKIDELGQRLGASPFGFTFEAQRLLFTALVARGVIEFVTSSGDRIGSRSLDLKLVWDDVAGISFPSESQYSADRLVKWAALLTGDHDLTSINSEAARKKVKASLSAWLEGWRQMNILEKLDFVADDSMTTALWHVTSRTRKSFGASADAITSVVSGTLDVEAGLRMIQEAFSASETEFKTLSSELNELSGVLDAFPARSSIRRRIAAYETTDDAATESVRSQISDALDASANGRTADIAALETLWQDFGSRFDSRLAESHAASARLHETRDKAAEIMSSHEWWVFENLANTGNFGATYRQTAREMVRELRVCNCTTQLAPGSSSPLTCPGCGYSLRASRRRQTLPQRLWALVCEALESFETSIGRQREKLSTAIHELIADEPSEDGKSSGASLAEKLGNGSRLLDLSEDELRMLQAAIVRYGPLHSSESFVPSTYSPAVTVIEDAVVLSS